VNPRREFCRSDAQLGWKKGWGKMVKEVRRKRVMTEERMRLMEKE
jgi:hypothetical protein